jgi:hypothetical protein
MAIMACSVFECSDVIKDVDFSLIEDRGEHMANDSWRGTISVISCVYADDPITNFFPLQDLDSVQQLTEQPRPTLFESWLQVKYA